MKCIPPTYSRGSKELPLSHLVVVDRVLIVIISIISDIRWCCSLCRCQEGDIFFKSVSEQEPAAPVIA